MSSSSLAVLASSTGAALLLKNSASFLKSSACWGRYCFSQPRARLEQMMLISMGESSLSTWGFSRISWDAVFSSLGLKASLPALQTGHFQSAGRSSHLPPTASSWIYPQMPQTYCFIGFTASFINILSNHDTYSVT